MLQSPRADYVLAGSPRTINFKDLNEHFLSNDLNSIAFESAMVDELVDSPATKTKRNPVPKPTQTEEEEISDEYRYVHLNDPTSNASYQYCNNTVITSRFTIYNFIPKLLFYEFSKLANAYFLIISIMQTIKPISNTGGFPASLPALTIIVLIDMFFASLEDYKRHQADHVANELQCLRFSNGTNRFESSKWASLQVGDVVKISNREAIPADVVILGAFEPDPKQPTGICYVETKSLDGETNLKLRQGLEATYTKIQSDADIATLTGLIVCEQPNNAIHRFVGTLSLNDKKEVITTNAVLLRGSTLRNTNYIYGLVVNTGPDTKIMMASSSTPMKWSNMEKRLNQQILYICTLMIILCLTGAIISVIWNARNLSAHPQGRAWYLYTHRAIAVHSPFLHFCIQVLYYFLLLNSFIPVSLYVSMTSVKFMQSYFMNQDLEMYHEESDTPCLVRTMSLNEELGQIDYIFSDKTGTLTCNIMEFRKCSINGISYGLGETEVGIAAKKRRHEEQDQTVVVGNIPTIIMEEQEDVCEKDRGQSHRVIQAPYVNYQDDTMFDAMALEQAPHHPIAMFWEHLAVCHTVMPERVADGSVRLSASSPDEQALVAAASCFGYKFSARAPGKALVESFSCFDQSPSTVLTNEYHILEVLEFNSTRKRMSVIMRRSDGTIELLCKGADTVMYERLRPTTEPHELMVRKQTLEHMEQFANDGLRTLVIAKAILDEHVYEEWVVRYRRAINDMRQIEKRRMGQENEIDRSMEEIEVNLQVLGATAIEDRLQQGVPDTIYKLREASIKIWMLTGDKEETAINIGFACRLLSPEINRIVISADTHPDLASIMKALEKARQERLNEESKSESTGETSRPITPTEQITTVPDHMNESALIIDGETLEIALEECPMLFLSVALHCVAVIACRVSPAQKAQLVQLVRDHNPHVRTLAIGDGANDVSMIQAAHVGIGISGQEGMQAASSSDYSIAQFRFLSKLLLVHGRWNYLRMGKLILYIFYKNVLMNCTQFWYMIYTGFSGQKYFLEWGLQGFNVLFTALPIVLISILEQDVVASYAHQYPILYRVGQENMYFNTKRVWTWITSCIWESLVISFGTIYGMKDLLEDGTTPTMWVYGCTAFTIVLVVVTLKLALHQQMYWPLHIFVYILSFSLWIATAAFISFGKSISSSYWNGVFTNVFGTKIFWLLVPLLSFTALSRDLFWKGYMRAFHPSYKHLAQEVHAFKLDHLADYLLSFPPPEKIPLDVETSVPPTLIRKPTIEEADLLVESKRLKAIPREQFASQGSIPILRHSISRGSAFSYDAESVMVESFMASERFSYEQPTKPIFERHASRGSMAFHTFVDDDTRHSLDSNDGNVANHTPHRRGRLRSTGGISTSNRPRRERLRSTGNIFRSAHSLRNRFRSASGSEVATPSFHRTPIHSPTLSPGRRYEQNLSLDLDTAVAEERQDVVARHASGLVRRYTAHLNPLTRQTSA